MYKCGACKKSTKLGEKIKRVIMATRPKSYFMKVKDEKTRKWSTVKVGEGSEIVSEISIGDCCVEKFGEEAVV